MNSDVLNQLSSRNVPDELVRYINTGCKFIIAGHKEPDGDCVGSQLALRSALLRLGKEVIVCSAGPFERTELKGYSEHFVSVITENDKSGAKLIIVDCCCKERTGSLEKDLEGLPCAIIDHHDVSLPPSTPEFPVYIDSEAPSCTLLVEKVITALGLKLTKEEAAFLLFGICTDTGFFRHITEKKHEVFEAAARIVRCGASPKSIFKRMNGGKTLKSRILLGHILSRTESYFDGKLLLTWETLEDIKKYGLKSRDSDNITRQLQAVEGVELIVIIRQESDDECTVSLRSSDKIDVAKIAASFGGGGHKNAAGLTIKQDISSVKQILLNSLKDIFVSK